MQMPYNPYLQAYMQALQQQIMPQQTQPQMTMPTIHADIMQVGSVEEAERFPIGAGASQMFILRDDSAILVKSASASGYTMEIYDRRPTAAQAPAIDPRTYVTMDELEKRLSALTGPIKEAE